MESTKNNGQKVNNIGQDVFKSILSNIGWIEIELEWGWDNNGKYNNDDYTIELDNDIYIDCKISIDEDRKSDNTGYSTMEYQSIELDIKKVWIDEDLVILSEKQTETLQNKLIKNTITS